MCELPYSIVLGLGKAFGLLRQSAPLFVCQRLLGRECSFPVPFQRPGNQAVIRIYRLVTAARERSFISRAFKPRFPLAVELSAFQFDILGRLQAHLDCSRQ